MIPIKSEQVNFLKQKSLSADASNLGSSITRLASTINGAEKDYADRITAGVNIAKGLETDRLIEANLMGKPFEPRGAYDRAKVADGVKANALFRENIKAKALSNTEKGYTNTSLALKVKREELLDPLVTSLATFKIKNDGLVEVQKNKALNEFGQANANASIMKPLVEQAKTRSQTNLNNANANKVNDISGASTLIKQKEATRKDKVREALNTFARKKITETDLKALTPKEQEDRLSIATQKITLAHEEDVKYTTALLDDINKNISDLEESKSLLNLSLSATSSSGNIFLRAKEIDKDIAAQKRLKRKLANSIIKQQKDYELDIGKIAKSISPYKKVTKSDIAIMKDMLADGKYEAAAIYDASSILNNANTKRVKNELSVKEGAIRLTNELTKSKIIAEDVKRQRVLRLKDSQNKITSTTNRFKSYLGSLNSDINDATKEMIIKDLEVGSDLKAMYKIRSDKAFKKMLQDKYSTDDIDIIVEQIYNKQTFRGRY